MAENCDLYRRQDGCSFVGLVVELRRADRYDYDASQCVVFGISREEHDYLTSLEGVEAKPKEYFETCPRFIFNCPPWPLMRALGENFGYIIPENLMGLTAARSDNVNTIVLNLVKPLANCKWF